MEWIRGHLLGSGSTATVSIATTPGGSKPFAAKSIELSKSETLQREQKILSMLDHPHIVSYKGYDITEEDNKLMYNLKMEYLPEGTLSDVYRKSGGRIQETMISRYARQILEGLDYLHSIGIVHCDIKGQNILTGKSGCKIADFGCAKWLNDTECGVPAMAGTPLFMAPEVARGEEQGCSADIWALGCTILEMATGCSPWPNDTNAASLLYKIAFLDSLPEIPENLSDQAKDLLSKCLRRNPKERWTAKQLLKHQFLDKQQANGVSKMENQETCTTSSPTSILDQDIWNTVQESDQPLMIPEKSRNTPAGRLRLLSIQSGHPNWTLETNWITIRDEEEKEEEKKDEGRLFCEDQRNKLRYYKDVDCNIKRCTEERFVNSNLRFGRYEKKQKLNPIHFL